MNMPVVTIVKDSNDESTVKVEGKVYNFDDRTGLWTVWSISNMTFNVSSVPNMAVLRAARLLNNVIIFQKRQIMKINPVLYTYGAQPSFVFLVTHQIEASKSSGTSYVWNSLLEDRRTGITLVERSVKVVTADKKTRRPSKIPEWFQDLHSGSKPLTNLSEQFATKSNIPKLSSNCFQWSTTVRHSDLDVNQHSNQSVYLKFCMDCATCAALAGRLRHFDSDMCWYPVKLVDIIFFGESFAGDKLVINLFQDEKDISTIHFNIIKDNQQITYAKFVIDLRKMSFKRQSPL